MTDRDNLLHARLMAVRADIGDRLVPALDKLIESPLTAGDSQEQSCRMLEYAIMDGIGQCRRLQGFVVGGGPNETVA